MIIINYYITVISQSKQVYVLYMQNEHETRLLILCDEDTDDENEVLYLLSQPDVDPNVYDEVNCL